MIKNGGSYSIGMLINKLKDYLEHIFKSYNYAKIIKL